jgi:hypothetical protein
MLDSAEFLQYAEEAARAAIETKNEEEKEAFLDLASVWTRAALRCREMLSTKGN